jgi:hypothetical protein
VRIPNEALRQRCTIRDYLGEGARGTTFSAPRTNIPASIQQTQGLTVDWKNENVTIDTLIMIRPEHGPVSAGSRVDIDGETYRVVKSFSIPDGFRPSHFELAVRLWEVE